MAEVRKRKKKKRARSASFIAREGFRFTTHVYLRSEAGDIELETVVDRAALISYRTINLMTPARMVKGTGFDRFSDWRFMTDEEINEYRRKSEV
jgi:hypothetical protein